MMQVDVSLGCYSSDKFPIKLSSSKPSPGLVGAGEPQLAYAWLTHPHLAPGWTVHGEWCQLCTQACGGKAAQFPVFLVRAPPLLPQQWKTLLLSSPLSNGTYMPLECLLLIWESSSFVILQAPSPTALDPPLTAGFPPGSWPSSLPHTLPPSS